MHRDGFLPRGTQAVRVQYVRAGGGQRFHLIVGQAALSARAGIDGGVAVVYAVHVRPVLVYVCAEVRGHERAGDVAAAARKHERAASRVRAVEAGQHERLAAQAVKHFAPRGGPVERAALGKAHAVHRVDKAKPQKPRQQTRRQVLAPSGGERRAGFSENRFARLLKKRRGICPDGLADFQKPRLYGAPQRFVAGFEIADEQIGNLFVLRVAPPGRGNDNGAARRIAADDVAHAQKAVARRQRGTAEFAYNERHENPLPRILRKTRRSGSDSRRRGSVAPPAPPRAACGGRGGGGKRGWQWSDARFG